MVTKSARNRHRQLVLTWYGLRAFCVGISDYQNVLKSTPPFVNFDKVNRYQFKGSKGHEVSHGYFRFWLRLLGQCLICRRTAAAIRGQYTRLRNSEHVRVPPDGLSYHGCLEELGLVGSLARVSERPHRATDL